MPRATSVLLAFAVIVGNIVLIAAAVGAGLLCGAYRVLSLSQWNVSCMTIESFKTRDDGSVHARIEVGVGVVPSKSSHVTSLSVPVGGGEFSLSLDAFTLDHESIDIDLVFDEDDIPTACSEVIQKLIAGKPVNVTVDISSLTVAYIPLPVEHHVIGLLSASGELE